MSTPQASLAEILVAPGGQAPATAGDVMTPGVVAVPVTATIDEAGRALAAHRVHAVLVVSCKGEPLGWLTASAVIDVRERHQLVSWAVDAIGEPLTTIDRDAPLAEVVEQLRKPDVSHLAVGKRPDLLPEGVISELDLAARAARS